MQPPPTPPLSRVTCAVFLSAIFCLAAGPAGAEDEPAPVRASPITRTADRIAKAVAAKDTSALKALAKSDQPDPWWVADELCARGLFDAALAFANAASRKDIERLPAYVVEQRATPTAPARRARLASASTALRSGAFAKVLEIAAAATAPTRPDVTWVLLLQFRSQALGALRRPAEAAASLRATGDAAQALGWYHRAARRYLDEGLAAWQASLRPLAREAFARARQAEALRGDHLREAIMLMNIANVDSSLGDQAKALEAYAQALKIHEALGNRKGAMHILGNMALAYQSLGDVRKALDLLERAKQSAEALGDEKALAGILGNLGSLYHNMSRFSKALGYQERSVKKLTELGLLSEAATIRGNMGSVYVSLGEFAKARACLERARAIKIKLGDEGAAARLLGGIGDIKSQLGDLDGALAIYQRVLPVLERVGDRVAAANLLGNVGILYFHRREFKKAIDLYKRSLALKEAMGERMSAADTLANMARVYANTGKPEQALEQYRRVLEIREAIGDKVGAARALGNMGSTLTALGKFDAARDHLRKSERQARSLRARRTRMDALALLAELYLAQGEFDRALTSSGQALEIMELMYAGLAEEEGASARQQQSQLFEVGTLAAVEEEDLAMAVHFLESGRAGALLDELGKRERLRWSAESLPEELRRAQDEAKSAESVARRAYDRASRRAKRPVMRAAAKALDRATEQVLQVAGRVQRELKQRVKGGLLYPRARTMEDIIDGLAKGQALVLYGLCRKEALAIVLERSGARVVRLGARQVVVNACAALDPSDPKIDPTKALAHLRKLLVEPLALPKAVTQVILSPEGELCYVPFGALFERAVAMTPSGTTHLLLLEEAAGRGTGRLGLGAPDYSGASPGAQAIYYRGRRLAPLPATKLEVETLATVMLLGEAATEAGLREALGAQRRWQAVHFACHGLIDVVRPMLSALALTRAGQDDGFLTALEVLRLPMPTDLAVLSACETGRGKVVKGEGILGLTRSFMFSGAARVLCSLWKVDDEATQALMVKFYELWRSEVPGSKTRLGAAAALKQAQAFVRQQAKWAHPYYWAAWTLWGLPE